MCVFFTHIHTNKYLQFPRVSVYTVHSESFKKELSKQMVSQDSQNLGESTQMSSAFLCTVCVEGLRGLLEGGGCQSPVSHHPIRD